MFSSYVRDCIYNQCVYFSSISNFKEMQYNFFLWYVTAAQFDTTGRPFHTMFYTGKPNFYHLMHVSQINFTFEKYWNTIMFVLPIHLNSFQINYLDPPKYNIHTEGLYPEREFGISFMYLYHCFSSKALMKHRGHNKHVIIDFRFVVS